MTLRSLAEHERAYIFQQSPYHSMRMRHYAPTSMRDAPKPLTPLAADDPSLEQVQVAPKQTHEQLLRTLHAMAGDPLENDGGRVVVHRGNPGAHLMIIGEAPGENEDREGKPFVGKAGQLLDKIFEYGGFDMERQVYITNVAKRRPLNNRNPTKEEVEYYLPYLHDEIEIVQPRIIVLAGSIAAKAFLGPTFKITAGRGRWQRLGGEEDGAPDIMPVFHPSYLLRFPEAKREMVTDIEEIRSRFVELVPEEQLRPLKKR